MRFVGGLHILSWTEALQIHQDDMIEKSRCTAHVIALYGVTHLFQFFCLFVLFCFVFVLFFVVFSSSNQTHAHIDITAVDDDHKEAIHWLLSMHACRR